jgi:hypothetical protein
VRNVREYGFSRITPDNLPVKGSIDLLNWDVLATAVEASPATSEILLARLPRVSGKQFIRLISAGVSTVPLGYLDTLLTPSPPDYPR